MPNVPENTPRDKQRARFGVRILCGDSRESLLSVLPDSVQTCVTSPPYFGLRDYGHAGQIGLEQTPEEYIAAMVEVFRCVRDVLADDGVLWLNIGDSYNAHPGQRKTTDKAGDKQQTVRGAQAAPSRSVDSLKPKDLIGIPWRVAFALQADGWYLRQDIIWHKPNPMPESVTDRPTKAHEYLFLLSKRSAYYYDADAIAEIAVASDIGAMDGGAQRLPDGSNANEGRNFRPGRSGNKERKPATARDCPRDGVAGSVPWEGFTRNRRTVWTVPTTPFSGAHFATFPPALIEPCIKAGSPIGGTVLDPFGGAGTTGLVADRLQRNALLIELNPEYAEMAERRIRGDAPLFAEVLSSEQV